MIFVHYFKAMQCTYILCNLHNIYIIYRKLHELILRSLHLKPAKWGTTRRMMKKCQLARQSGSWAARRVLTMHGVRAPSYFSQETLPCLSCLSARGIKGGFRHKLSKPQLTASQSEGDSHNFRFFF